MGEEDGGEREGDRKRGTEKGVDGGREKERIRRGANITKSKT